MRDNSSLRIFRCAALALACATMTIGCEEKKESPVVETPTPTKEVVAGGPIDKLAAPAGVLVFGGADSPAALGGERRGDRAHNGLKFLV